VIPIFDPLYPYFSRNFNVGFDKIGLVFFGGSLTAIIAIISAGRLSDKFPLRKLFLWSFAISFAGFAVSEEKILFYGGIMCVASLLCFSFINIIYIKIFFLILIGISIAGIYPLCGAIAISANPKSAGTSSGISIAMGLVGGLIVSPVMGFVAQYLSKSYVPYVLIVLAVIGSIMSAILLKISLNKNKDGVLKP
jgi:MFS family permease